MTAGCPDAFGLKGSKESSLSARNILSITRLAPADSTGYVPITLTTFSRVCRQQMARSSLLSGKWKTGSNLLPTGPVCAS